MFRHQKEHKYQTTIVKGESFVETMTAFVSKGKDLKIKGKGSKPKAASTITDFEIEQPKTAGQLGNITPSSLINTLWLNNSLHFWHVCRWFRAQACTKSIFKTVYFMQIYTKRLVQVTW